MKDAAIMDIKLGDYGKNSSFPDPPPTAGKTLRKAAPIPGPNDPYDPKEGFDLYQRSAWTYRFWWHSVLYRMVLLDPFQPSAQEHIAKSVTPHRFYSFCPPKPILVQGYEPPPWQPLHFRVEAWRELGAGKQAVKHYQIFRDLGEAKNFVQPWLAVCGLNVVSN